MPTSSPIDPSSLGIPGVELGEIIGRGGFATVYRARQTTLDRDVAVKIDSRSLDDDRNRRRFLREATAASRISSHPHVVSLVDVGTTADNRPYLVMELCENGSIAEMLRRSGPFRADDVVEIGLAVSSALAAAHEAGVLHRDVKPGNILIDHYGTPRLTDFGLAALPVPGEDLSVTIEALTPAYAPPEAFDQRSPTPQADVWSLGATLYAMLAGQPSRTNSDGTPKSIVDVIAQTRVPFVDPDLPGSDLLMPVIARATTFAPTDRYADGAALHAALIDVRDQIRDRLRAEVGAPARVVGGPEAHLITSLRPEPSVPELEPAGGQPTRSRRPMIVVAALGLVVGLVLGAVGGYSVRTSTPPSGPSLPSGPGGAATPVPAAGSPNPQASPSSLPPQASPSAPPTGVCWGGTVSIAGRTTAASIACTKPHAWETYASGLLDATTGSSADDAVAADPVVAATCTRQNLTDYVGAARSETFQRSLVPPSEVAFAQGERGFACVASVKGAGRVTGSIKG